jgi:hypothetical protein
MAANNSIILPNPKLEVAAVQSLTSWSKSVLNLFRQSLER